MDALVRAAERRSTTAAAITHHHRGRPGRGIGDGLDAVLRLRARTAAIGVMVLSAIADIPSNTFVAATGDHLRLEPTRQAFELVGVPRDPDDEEPLVFEDPAEAVAHEDVGLGRSTRGGRGPSGRPSSSAATA